MLAELSSKSLHLLARNTPACRDGHSLQRHTLGWYYIYNYTEGLACCICQPARACSQHNNMKQWVQLTWQADLHGVAKYITNFLGVRWSGI